MRIIAFYSDTKQQLATSLGATEDLLHMHAGLLIFFAAALFLRQRMRSWLPIVIVYAFALGNELVDLLNPESSANQWEPLVDIANTVLWPTLLFLLARRRALPNEGRNRRQQNL